MQSAVGNSCSRDRLTNCFAAVEGRGFCCFYHRPLLRPKCSDGRNRMQNPHPRFRTGLAESCQPLASRLTPSARRGIAALASAGGACVAVTEAAAGPAATTEANGTRQRAAGPCRHGSECGRCVVGCAWPHSRRQAQPGPHQLLQDRSLLPAPVARMAQPRTLYIKCIVCHEGCDPPYCSACGHIACKGLGDVCLHVVGAGCRRRAPD